ncbi:carbon storage regulator, partial [Borreliella burgdorferi]
MLVLSRKANESIKINSDIEVLILEIKKDAVK